jgi:hypothetical protein
MADPGRRARKGGVKTTIPTADRRNTSIQLGDHRASRPGTPIGFCCTFARRLERPRSRPVPFKVPWSPPTNPSAPLPSPSPPPATPAAATQPAGSSSSGSRAPSQAAQNASVNRLRDHSGRLESSRRPPGAFKAAVTHPANSATTFSGALDPLDKVCGHLFRRLEADRRAKGLAGPPDPTGPGLGTPRIYIRIPVTTTTTSGGRPRRSIRRSRASRRRSPRKRRGARRSWRKSRSRPRRRPRRRPSRSPSWRRGRRRSPSPRRRSAQDRCSSVHCEASAREGDAVLRRSDDAAVRLVYVGMLPPPGSAKGF